MKNLKFLRQLVKVQPLLLALLMQLSPLAKIIPFNPLLAATPIGIVLRLATMAVAVAGTCQAVSGASTYISGLTRCTSTAPSGVVLGSLTNNAYGTNGNLFLYRITVVNAGTDHNKDYFNCLPLPPGLTINTNLGGSGFISNSPPGYVMTPGVYPVTLLAGNTSCSGCVVTYDVLITIIGNGSPPVITGLSGPKTVFEGGAADFGVTNSGTAPFGYEWRKNGSALNGQTASNLTFAAATTNDTASYTAVITNAYGAVTSSPAKLTVVGLPKLTANRTNDNVRLEFLQFPNASYALYYGTNFPATNWVVLTNFVNSTSNTLQSSTDSATNSLRRFYQIQTTIP